MKSILLVSLVVVPGVAYYYLLYRLAAHRRDGGGFVRSYFTPNLRVLRPDLYTDDGQHLLRVTWALAVLVIPYILVVVTLLR